MLRKAQLYEDAGCRAGRLRHLQAAPGPLRLRLRRGPSGAGGASVPQRPEREAEGPSGLLYREGLLPFVTLAVASRRLCQTAAVGNLLSLFSSITGTLLGFYLTFTGSYQVLTPVLLMTYLLLWVAPMLPLVWTADKL